MKSTHLNSFLPQNKLLVYPKHVCCCSVAKSCLILCDPMDCMLQASLSFTISLSLLKLMFTELMLVSNHLIFCHPLLFLPSIFPSIRVSSNESSLHIRLAKHWNFSTSPSKEYSGFISFRIGWFDLLAAKDTLEKLK